MLKPSNCPAATKLIYAYSQTGQRSIIAYTNALGFVNEHAIGALVSLEELVPKHPPDGIIVHQHFFCISTVVHAPFLFEKFLLLAPGLLFSCILLLFYFWPCSLLLLVSEGMLLAPGLPLTEVHWLENYLHGFFLRLWRNFLSHEIKNMKMFSTQNTLSVPKHFSHPCD